MLFYHGGNIFERTQKIPPPKNGREIDMYDFFPLKFILSGIANQRRES